MKYVEVIVCELKCEKTSYSHTDTGHLPTPPTRDTCIPVFVCVAKSSLFCDTVRVINI